MAVGSYFTTVGPTTTEQLLVQMESTVRIGTSRLYGSLETTSFAYTAYEASIGLAAGQSWELGQVDSIGIEVTSELEEVESANIRQSGIFVAGAEEATLSVGVREYNVNTLDIAMNNAIMYRIGDEVLFTVGGACTTKSRPIEVAATNIACGAPSTTGDVESGVSAIVVTFYDMQCTSGLPWGDIVAGELNTLELEFSALPVTARALGNRFMSIYVF